jgi:TetR/AcrR family transcriptional regulator, regulator of autoinduction and epiphytic fitness
MAAPTTDLDARRRALLSAAIQVFARFGYRRASMDEVARAAQLSRQGLYFHFPTKEALFREAVTHVLSECLGAAKRAIDGEGTIEDRLVLAFDAIHGPLIGGAKTSHLAELIEASEELFGDLVGEQEEKFRGAVARALTEAGIAEGAAKSGVTARDLALTLDAVATGLEHTVASRDELTSRMRTAIRAVCRTPLAGRALGKGSRPTRRAREPRS